MSQAADSDRPRTAGPIHPDTTLGTVRLTVVDLDRSRAFYERSLGLRSAERDDGMLTLGVGDGGPLIELRGDSSAGALNRRATGLFHLAILVPGRRELAQALGRLAQSRWPLDGASDHLVSEALYLSDPDGNGIEIYRDRPRRQWKRTGDQVDMATLPLDVDNLLGELGATNSRPELAPSGTRIGHVHLQVSDLADAERFYHEVLGFDVMVRGYPGALFVSAGGYHHHIGLNTWHSQGAAPPSPGSVGLRSFEVILPSEPELERVVGRFGDAGITAERAQDGVLVRDPSDNGVVLRGPAGK